MTGATGAQGRVGKHDVRKSGEARMILLATLKFGISFVMKREITERRGKSPDLGFKRIARLLCVVLWIVEV